MSNEVPVEKLVKVYLKIKDTLAEKRAAYDEEEKKLKDKMAKVKSALLDYCREEGVESVKTTEGMFYRTVSTRYWTNDWESMGRFIVENNVPDLLEKRLHQGNMVQFLKENPETLPPGLNVDSEYSVTVRRK
jgi:ATP-dependent Lon protease